MRWIVPVCLALVLAGCAAEPPEEEDDCGYGPCDIEVDFPWWFLWGPYVLGLGVLVAAGGLVYWLVQRPPEQP